MPGFDRTGPEGQGSQTGRKLGKCAPNNQESTKQLDAKEYPGRFGRGMGRGFGFGRGSGRGTGRGLGRRNEGGNA